MDDDVSDQLDVVHDPVASLLRMSGDSQFSAAFLLILVTVALWLVGTITQAVYRWSSPSSSSAHRSAAAKRPAGASGVPGVGQGSDSGAGDGILAEGPATEAAEQVEDQLPDGWQCNGTLDEYDIGIDFTPGLAYVGEACGYVASKVADPEGLGTLLQMVLAKEYRGRRVRVSGWVRTDNVSLGSWCGLWFRCDDTDGHLLAYDNMEDRPIGGTTPWTQYDLVLDVPKTADHMSFGIHLVGTGTAWLDALSVDVVSRDVPTTGHHPFRARQRLSTRPINLAFEWNKMPEDMVQDAEAYRAEQAAAVAASVATSSAASQSPAGRRSKSKTERRRKSGLR